MRLVVIGGVAAGLSAAARARRLARSLEIVVLEKGPVISYAACGLPYLVEGIVARSEELIFHTPEEFARDRAIEVRTGTEVTGIAHSRREVTLAGGHRLHYDRLVIATGARVARGGIKDASMPHVFTLQTLEDAQRLTDFLVREKPRKAAVIGGGYIGLEAAEALRARGLAVTLWEASASLLGRADADLTSIVAGHLARCRVTLKLNSPVASVRDLDCDVVVLAAGMNPNIELAAAAGARVGRTGAIAADERMETSLNGVYAAGDCAETTHIVTGQPVWIPLGTTANKMGRVAGANAAGRRARFPGVAGTSIVRACGLGVAVTGLSEAEARAAGFDPVSARITARDRSRYFRSRPATVSLVADRRTRRLLGGFVVGEHEVAGRINVIAAALAARQRLDDFEQLDLAYAPPYAPVWDPLLIAAQQLAKLLD